MILTDKERLYDERISALNDEILQLSMPKPTHPEYLRQLGVIHKYRNDKFDFEQNLLVFKVQSLKTKSVAQRSQIHSAYYQTIRDVREKHLDEIGERMSRMRRDHINGDEKIPNYSIPFPTKRSTQITQQTAFNKEVSILSGVAKYVGFPAAPSISSAAQHELDEDLGKMGVSIQPKCVILAADNREDLNKSNQGPKCITTQIGAGKLLNSDFSSCG